MLFCCGALWRLPPPHRSARPDPHRPRASTAGAPSTADGAQPCFERRRSRRGISARTTRRRATFKWQRRNGTAHHHPCADHLRLRRGHLRPAARPHGRRRHDGAYHPKGHGASTGGSSSIRGSRTRCRRPSCTSRARSPRNSRFHYPMQWGRCGSNSSPCGSPGRVAERAHRMPEHGRQAMATLRRSPAPAGNHLQVRARNPRPGRQRRPGHRVRPRAGNAQASCKRLPLILRRARCRAERAHAADPVRRNRVETDKTGHMKTIFRLQPLHLSTAFCACDDDKSYVAPWMSRPTTSPAFRPMERRAPRPELATYTSSSSAKTRSTSCTRT